MYSPVKIGFGDKVRQTDDGNPAESRFIAVIDTVNAFLPPEPFEWRNYIVVKALDTMVCLVAHLQGVGNGIQDADCLLISAAFIVGIALAAHGDVIRLWDNHDNRFCRREIELLAFFLKIEGHLSEFILYLQRYALAAISARACLFIMPFPPALG